MSAIEAVAVLTRRDAHRAQERAAQRFGSAEPRLLTYDVEGLMGFLEQPARCLDANRRDETRGGCSHLAAEDAGKVARAHRRAGGEPVDGQIVVRVGGD